MFTPDNFFPTIPNDNFFKDKVLYGLITHTNPLYVVGFGNRIIEIEISTTKIIPISSIVLVNCNKFNILRTPPIPKIHFHSTTELLVTKKCKDDFICYSESNNRIILNEQTKSLFSNLYNHWYSYYIPSIRFPLSLDEETLENLITTQEVIHDLIGYVISYSPTTSKGKRFINLTVFFGYNQRMLDEIIYNIVQNKTIHINYTFDWRVPLIATGDIAYVSIIEDDTFPVAAGDWIYLTDMRARKSKDQRYFIHTTKTSSIIRLKGTHSAVIIRIGRLVKMLPKEITKQNLNKCMELYPSDALVKRYKKIVEVAIDKKIARSAKTMYKKLIDSDPSGTKTLNESSEIKNHETIDNDYMGVYYNPVKEFDEAIHGPFIEKKEPSQWYTNFSNNPSQSIIQHLAPFSIPLLSSKIPLTSLNEIYSNYSKLSLKTNTFRVIVNICDIYPQNRDEIIQHVCGCIQRKYFPYQSTCPFCLQDIKKQFRLFIQVYDSHETMALIKIRHETISSILLWYNNDPCSFYDTFSAIINPATQYELFVTIDYDPLTNTCQLCI
ncbi:Uncharacterized protein QTN25_002669 [Entamoeba marina]